jgi:5-methyltetrahydrofolate--homocysteine methyltransferase
MMGADARDLFSGVIAVADGSTGTALEALAPGLGERAALLPLENPTLLESLHAAYFAAGSALVETATFTASACGLERLAGAAGAEERDPSELAYRVNRAAAETAVRAARAAAAGLRRWVAGSMGPGDEPPSLGAATWAKLRDSYVPQARGLADGGADLALVETCQDPLQAKAAIAALAAPEGGRGLPFIVSATVDGRGRLLAGTSIEAFVAIMAPFRPLAIGLNCSGGPDELEGPLAELSAISPFPICFMPNAGLPRSVDGRTSWPVGPSEFGSKVAALARRYGVAIAGGCCGTGPEHIRSLATALADRPAVRPRPRPRPALASLYETRPIGPGLFKIGERANAAGSASFAAALAREDFEEMAEIAIAQEGAGAGALDLHLAKAGRDESADLAAMAGALASRARAALCLDTSDPAALERALPLIGGRPLINSASLEDPARARRVFALAREHGAAVVCLAVDGAGPARGAEDKARVCRALYDMAVGESGLDPASLLFDTVTFTAAAGPAGGAAETLRAIPLVKERCPGSFTVLGVGNISYGLPKKVRPAVTSVFLGLAREAGLDAAIVNCGGIPDPAALDPATREAATALILGTSREDYDPLAILLGSAGAAMSDIATSGGSQAAALDPEAALERAVARGDGSATVAAARILADSGSSGRIAAAVARAMGERGRLWSEGELPLPLVLRSAEAARKALALAAAGGEGESSKGTVVMATVQGDLHDIGKNIAAAIIACSGWRVVDLGTDVAAERIVRVAEEEGATAIGLSGLLTRSLERMREVCAALEGALPDALVLCGGAAVNAEYAERVLAPEHRGRVVACTDAFDAVRVLDAGAIGSGDIPSGGVAAEPPPRKPASRIAPKTAPAFVPPRLGAVEIGPLGLDELLGRLDEPTLFGARWGYRREDFPAARAELDVLASRLRGRDFPGARALGGFFRCRRSGDSTLEIEDSASGATYRFPFPIEASSPRRCVAAYFAEAGDVVALLAASVSPELSREAEALRSTGALEEYWRLHGLGSAFAEAAAELVHARLSAEMEAAGSGCSGRRYSFGFPACPGVEHQGALLALLGAERIGLELTSGFQLKPEHSVTAFIVARPDAEYFSI